MDRKKTLRATGLSAAIAIWVCAGQALAQSAPLPSAANRSGLNATGGSAPQAVDRESLILGQSLVSSLNLEQRLRKAVDAQLTKSVVDLERLTGKQPVARQRTIVAAYREAIMATGDEITTGLYDRLAIYFAENASQADLRDAVEFYRSPIGRKMVVEPTSLTQDEKQIAGARMMSHPGIIKVAGLEIAASQISQKYVSDTQHDVSVHFAKNLCRFASASGLPQDGTCVRNVLFREQSYLQQTAAANNSTKYPVLMPEWIISPAASDSAQFYPDLAQRKGINGSATIRCTVSVEGDLKDCLVIAEDPAGYNFGAQTIKASRNWKLKPPMKKGVAVEGTVTVPMRWAIK